jgi:long-chain acyl-CoA synthetase
MNNMIFLTGATGLVGGNLLVRILQRDATTTVSLLVRSDSDRKAEERIINHLKQLSPEIDYKRIAHRIRIICGDVTESQFGLSDEKYNELAKRTTHVVHSAATVQFNLSLDVTRAINVGGTKQVMSFAKRVQESGSLKRVAHISTAYVSGNRSGVIYEDMAHSATAFSNSYEHAKYEAEQYVRGLMKELPIMIFRPSIIVGDSATGATTAFNVLYGPLKLISRGLLRYVPGSSSTPLDVVPVDYVADAMYHIFFESNEQTGKTYHLTAGKENVSTAGEIVKLAVKYFDGDAAGRKTRRIRFLPLSFCNAAKRFLRSELKKLLEMMKPFEPYLCVRRIFDDTNTSTALRGTNIVPPRFEQYHETILRYCIEANWGRQMRRAS